MANKKITDATQISTMSGSDKLFVNSGDDLKQITLDQAVAASTPVQQLNSNIEFSTLVRKAKNLEPNTDLNTITTSGIYYLLNATTWGNAPNTKVTNSYLIVIAVNTKRCNKILESNYTPYDSTGVVRAKLIGYGTTLLYSSASQHYAFARYYTKDGEKGAWATSEFQKGDYITGSLIFS